jgi:hypothetical protein
MKDRKMLLRWWMVAGAVGALLGGGVALASDCWKCIPCGCSPDGGDMMCCNIVPCDR